MSRLPLAHVAEHCLCAEENTFEIHGDIEIPIFLTNFRNRVMDGDARVANENIDPAEPVERLFHHRVHLRFFRYISWYCEGLLTECRYLVRNGFNL